MWGIPVLGCALLVSGLLLRRWPLAALAVLLGGSVASTAQQPVPARTELVVAVVVLACGAGLEICYMAATRSRRVSVAGVAMLEDPGQVRRQRHRRVTRMPLARQPPRVRR
jgi:hypothetical protein